MKDHSIFVSVALASALLFSPFSTHAQTAKDLPPHVTEHSHNEAPNDHVLGSKDAATTMIVWASVTCPHCGDWFSTEWPLVKSELVETGKLRFIFREFPTAPPELSMTGFRLANCAPTADYMSIIEYQMEQQQEIFKAAQEGRAPEIYREIAKMGGMETDEAISTCLSNPDMTAYIKDNVDRATLAKISGVPAFLINGQSYKGPQDADSLIKLITQMDEDGIKSLPNDVKAATSHTEHDHE
jgi:protein-disulfide isomerase